MSIIVKCDKCKLNRKLLRLDKRKTICRKCSLKIRIKTDKIKFKRILDEIPPAIIDPKLFAQMIRFCCPTSPRPNNNPALQIDDDKPLDTRKSASIFKTLGLYEKKINYSSVRSSMLVFFKKQSPLYRCLVFSELLTRFQAKGRSVGNTTIYSKRFFDFFEACELVQVKRGGRRTLKVIRGTFFIDNKWIHIGD